jgi:hypothetical protein
VLYASSYWGQQDSLVAFFMLLACWLAWGRQPVWAAAALAVGTIVKPQPLVLVPLLAWIVWRRSSWRGLLVAVAVGAVVLALGHAYLLTGTGGASGRSTPSSSPPTSTSPSAPTTSGGPSSASPMRARRRRR